MRSDQVTRLSPHAARNGRCLAIYSVVRETKPRHPGSERASCIVSGTLKRSTTRRRVDHDGVSSCTKRSITYHHSHVGSSLGGPLRASVPIQTLSTRSSCTSPFRMLIHSPGSSTIAVFQTGICASTAIWTHTCARVRPFQHMDAVVRTQMRTENRKLMHNFDMASAAYRHRSSIPFR